MKNQVEAIVLKTLPFQDYHQITTLFTAELGLCNAIGSYSRSPKNPLFGALAPLNHLELFLRPPRNGDLFKIESVSLFNSHNELRKSYDQLHEACQMLNALMKTQVPHKPAPLIFGLLKNYLSLIQEAPFPEAIRSSFQLKLLRHEGLLAITNQCPICHQEPKEISIEEGRTVCKAHCPDHGLTEDESTYFYALALSTSAKLLKEVEPPKTLAPKIEALFSDILHGI